MRPTDFSPAEALYLLFGEKVSILSLVKATVLDLARREVLAISLDPDSQEMYKARVSAGPALSGHKPTPFEAPFVARFTKVPDWRPPLRFYSLDLMRRPYSSVVKCLAAVHSHPPFRAYIVDNFFRTLVGGYRANKAGEKMAAEIRVALREGLDLLVQGRADEASVRMGGLAILLDLPEIDRGIQLPTNISAPEVLRNHAAMLGGVFLLFMAAREGSPVGTLFGAFDQAITPPRQPRKPAGEGDDGDDSYAGGDGGSYDDDDDGSDGYDSDGDGGDGDGGDGGGDSGCSGCGGCGGGD